MVVDFFTKPLQGKKFLQFRKLIMNLQDWNLPWPKECVGNQLVLFYLNCPMFGLHSHLLPVLFRMHDWIIFCSRLIILTSLFVKLLQYEVKNDLRRLNSWHIFTIAIDILKCLLAKPWELLTMIIQYNSSI